MRKPDFRIWKNKEADQLFGDRIPYRVSFHSMKSDPRVHARGGARGKNLVHLQN